MTSLLILQHQRPDGEVDTYHLKAGRRYHLGRGSQCQIRILDLKLSRQHCAFEHLDAGWVVADLASTNGCTHDGERIDGNAPLHAGSTVVAGSTTVTVARICLTTDPEASLPAPAAPNAEPDRSPEQVEAGPVRASERMAAAASHSNEIADDLEPQPISKRATISDPLIPASATPVVTPPPQPPPQRRHPSPQMLDATPMTQSALDHDVLATLPPAARMPAPPPAPAPAQATVTPGAPDDDGGRTFFITVLGKRVGPLTRAQARELKSRELRGTLTPAELASVEALAAASAAASTPAPAAAAPPAPPPPAAAASDEPATYYVTLLGQRVGPLTRVQARELKARELKGQLTEAEIAHIVAR